MTLWYWLIGLWAGIAVLMVGWALYTWWRDRQAETRSSLRLVQRFRETERD